jgi:hypothetical protein
MLSLKEFFVITKGGKLLHKAAWYQLPIDKPASCLNVLERCMSYLCMGESK